MAPDGCRRPWPEKKGGRIGLFVFVLFGLIVIESGIKAVRMYLLFGLVPALAGRRPVV